MPKLLTLLLAAAAGAQVGPTETARASDAPCARRPLEAPGVRGFRLGMTVRQTVAAYPELKVAPGDFGTAEAWIIPAAGQRVGDPRLEGVSGVFLTFLNDKVYSVEVHYGGKNPWRSMGEFTSAVSGTMGLTKPWTRDGEVWSLTCDGFRLLATAPDFAPTLYLTDLHAERTLAGLREKPEPGNTTSPGLKQPFDGDAPPVPN